MRTSRGVALGLWFLAAVSGVTCAVAWGSLTPAFAAGLPGVVKQLLIEKAERAIGR